MSIPDQGLVETYFKGMAAGADGEQDLMSVFADDAVYTSSRSLAARVFVWSTPASRPSTSSSSSPTGSR